MTTEITSYSTSSEVKKKMKALVENGKYKSMNAIVTTGIKKILAEEGV